MEQVRTDARTKYEAIGDVAYGRRVNFIHARLYRRLRGLLTFMAVIAGSTGLAGVIGNSCTGAGCEAGISYGAIAGMIAAVAAAIELAVSPADKAPEFTAMSRRFAHLMTRSSEMTLEQIDTELWALQEDSVGMSEIEALREIAMNDVCRESGRPDYARKENWRVKIFRALA